eukprot:8451008-Pyramimonas_sp.AAC.1
MRLASTSIIRGSTFESIAPMPLLEYPDAKAGGYAAAKSDGLSGYILRTFQRGNLPGDFKVLRALAMSSLFFN